MRRFIGRAVGAGAISGILFFAPLVAAETALAVNAGLWEIVSQRESRGAPQIPPEALANMPPEQRAKIEAALQNQNKPHVSKTCLTADQLQRGFALRDKESLKTCKKTVLKSTSEVLDVRVECAGERTTVGNIHYEAVDPETIQATIDLVMSNGKQSMTMRNNMRGKWLSADCGDVKAHEAGK